MVLISHKQACRDLGIKPCQLRKWQKDIDKIRSLHKGTMKANKLSHPTQFLILEDRLHTLILEDRLHTLILEKWKLRRKVRENWIHCYARLEFESLWLERVTIVEKRNVFAGIVF
jgi:hypothetical protein